jgi:hypothetical protein
MPWCHRDWKLIEQRLLALAGDVVVEPLFEPDLVLLRQRGREIAAPVVVAGADCCCHDNAARLFVEGCIDRLAVGFALRSGGWVQHTWGMRDSTIIEPTCERRERYWGVVLSLRASRKRAVEQLEDEQLED